MVGYDNHLEQVCCFLIFFVKCTISYAIFMAYTDTVREERHVAPAHYSMTIDSFSLLSDMVANSYLEQYESREFEASGYKW